MKKKSIIILLSIFLVVLTSFSIVLFVQSRPFKLSSYGSAEISAVPISDIESMAAKQESFLVFISQPDCRTADDFEKVINELLTKTSLQIYKTDFMYLRDTNLAPEVRHYPSLLIFKNGKLITFLDPTSNADTPAFKNSDDLRQWLSKYIILQG